MDKQSKIGVLKECKFLKLCEHQTGVQLTLLSCIFTPKWCKDDLHTILNAFKYSNTDLVYISIFWCLVTPKLGYRKPILVLKYTKNISPLHCSGVLVTLKRGNDDTEYV